MRAALLAAIAASVFPSALAETDAALPLGPGSALYWQSSFDGSSDQYTETVIAAGEDFKIYKSNNDFSDHGPEDFFALFSGIDFRPCNEDMPAAEDRAAAAALWPLEVGKRAEVLANSDNPVKIEILQETNFFLMGQSLPAHVVKIDYQDNDETEDEDVVVLDDTKITVRLDWSATSRDALTLVTKPRPDAVYDLSEEAIGACAALLTETQK
ncbi:MAG: hypothetical protein AAFR51_04315 [Pseudomonadota bacterium]